MTVEVHQEKRFISMVSNILKVCSLKLVPIHSSLGYLKRKRYQLKVITSTVSFSPFHRFPPAHLSPPLPE
jgi:hypothetical protein